MMKQRRKRVGVLLAVLLSALTACSQADAPVGQTHEEQPSADGQVGQTQEEAAQADNAYTAIPAPTDYVSEEEMALADCFAGSKEEALAAVMKKASRKDAVTIAVIGGSITQGTISTGSIDSSVTERKCYADIFFSWWEENFPETEFTFINAGIGATDSYLGVHRVNGDVLEAEPDLVLVEFAVNDADTPFYKKTYDNLVRIIVGDENEPALLLLFMAQTNGASAQGNQSAIGFQYSLPMISYGGVLKEMMETGKYTAQDLSGDTVHPSALGHAITGEILWRYLSSIYENMEQYGEAEPFTKAAVTKECYTNAAILDARTLIPDSMEGFSEKKLMDAFADGWGCEEGNGEITFTLSFANLGVLYYRQIDGNGAQYEVCIDGEAVAVLDADFAGGWGNYAEAQECFTSDTAREHEVTIRRKEDSLGDDFGLLGLLVSSP
ncbi:MAG: SGNH/GDSL hydrolase family protein [Roseburia sp.]|nr:SGNH/GDSL hydrolase family protein [Roseburia sp.]MCM1243510.1 SGNH/GDSL hydrolase family protein [Roseburia sp.]